MKRTVQVTGILAATLVSGLLFFTACKKNAGITDTSIDDTRFAIQDDAESDYIFDDVFTNVMGIDADAGIGTGITTFRTDGTTTGMNRGNGLDSITPCFTITRVPVAIGVFPKTITIDFGTGCTGLDGHTRRGKIVTVYSGSMIVAGSEATTTFVNYYVDTLHVEGTHKVKNNSTGTSTRIFTRTVTGGKISFPSGNYIQWDATHTNTQTAGLGTPFIPLDDEFDITGTATGTNYRGAHITSWTHTIGTPLHKKFTCHWFVSGTITFDRNGHSAVLDYGTGNCDNQATLTIGGQTYPITLY